jgi:hypothetical protein
MIGYFRIQQNENDAHEVERIMRVDGIANLKDAVTVLERIRAQHADIAVLISLEPDYALHYTRSEVMEEQNLLGGRRR